MDDYRKLGSGWGSKERKGESRAGKAAFRAVAAEEPALYIVVGNARYFLAGGLVYFGPGAAFEGSPPTCGGRPPCDFYSHMGDYGQRLCACGEGCGNDLGERSQVLAGTVGQPDAVECFGCGAKYEIREVASARAA